MIIDCGAAYGGNAKPSALKHLDVLTKHIDESVKFLQRSFRLFEDPNLFQERIIEMENDRREDAISRDGKRKRETEDSESDLLVKKLKETESKLVSTQELLRRTRQTKTLDTVILSDDGISKSQDLNEIIHEINKGSIIFYRNEADTVTDDSHPTDENPSIISNTISLSQNFVNEILKTNPLADTQDNSCKCDNINCENSECTLVS